MLGYISNTPLLDSIRLGYLFCISKICNVFYVYPKDVNETRNFKIEFMNNVLAILFDSYMHYIPMSSFLMTNRIVQMVVNLDN